MQERQEEKSDSSNRPPIVSEESPAIEPSSGSDSTTDDVSDPGLVRTYVCFVHRAVANRQ